MKNSSDVVLLGFLTEEHHLSERVIDPKGICFTLMAMTHGYGQGFIYEEGGDTECNV